MLTDTKLRALKPGLAPLKLADSGGLHILVTPAGGKLWKLAYRFNGKQKTLSGGPYPAVSLAEARAWREMAKAQLRQGIDPGHIVKIEKQEAVAAATTGTFRAVARDWRKVKVIKQKRSDSTVRRTDWLLRTLNEHLGDRPINEITAPELLTVLRRIEAKELHETVARMRSVASRIFRYGIADGKCERDVAADLRGATTVATATPHAAIIDPAGIGELLRTIDSLGADHGRGRAEDIQHANIMRLALSLLALTFVRPSELRLAEWHEIDMTAATWTIPPGRTKMRREHLVPLSRQAVAAFGALRDITGKEQLVLASPINPKVPVNKNAFNDTLRRIGFAHDQHVAHGFRATASTCLNGMHDKNNKKKWPVDVIERQLAHIEASKVRRVYNRAEYWPQRVPMMQAWADYLDELRQRGQVVALPKAAAR
jgi:integrase